MSTRCLIGYLDREPGVRNDVIFSYCHFDGYPSGVGKTLVEYYNTPELALKISSLHGFSSLKKTYEDKSKSNDKTKKEELSLLIDFYNESIKELQTNFKTCELIKNNHDKMTNELNENNKEYNRY